MKSSLPGAWTDKQGSVCNYIGRSLWSLISTAVTKHHRQVGFNDRNLFSHGSRREKSEINVEADSGSP